VYSTKDWILNYLKTKLIAEISGNHLGSLENCISLINAAKQAGASAVKIQTYKPETMTLPLRTPSFSISKDHELWGGVSLFDLYKKAHTPWEWHENLFNFARQIGIQIFSTPFDKSAVDLLEELNTPLYKIASLESGDIPLIKYIAKTQKPIIASTGASTLSEIDDLVNAVLSEGNKNLTLLLCTSAYPTPIDQVHLMRIDLLKERYNLPVGLSDHTLGSTASLAAVAKGASVIERHFILDRQQGGPDSAFSLEPEELAALSAEIIEIELSLGIKEWKIQHDESESRRLRRSLIITKKVFKGEKVSLENVKSLRPAIGLQPKFFEDVVGYTFNEDFEIGTPLTFGIISRETN
jgi:pseudaminic acid synthase